MKRNIIVGFVRKSKDFEWAFNFRCWVSRCGTPIWNKLIILCDEGNKCFNKILNGLIFLLTFLGNYWITIKKKWCVLNFKVLLKNLCLNAKRGFSANHRSFTTRKLACRDKFFRHKFGICSYKLPLGTKVSYLCPFISKAQISFRKRERERERNIVYYLGIYDSLFLAERRERKIVYDFFCSTGSHNVLSNKKRISYNKNKMNILKYCSSR